MSAFNDIVQIKFVESEYNIDLFRITGTWYAELNEDSIVTYYVKFGSRKKYNRKKTAVPYKEMKAFFNEIYKLIRTADTWGVPVDDTGYTITLKYSSCHKEIIEGDVEGKDKHLLVSIYDFLELHGNTYGSLNDLRM